MQNCANFSVLSMELPQSCTKPSIYAYPWSYPGYFREPHWKSMGFPEISSVTWEVCIRLISYNIDWSWVDLISRSINFMFVPVSFEDFLSLWGGLVDWGWYYLRLVAPQGMTSLHPGRCLQKVVWKTKQNMGSFLRFMSYSFLWFWTS